MSTEESFVADPKVRALYPEGIDSGNTVNGLGETTPRQPSPFFWHAVDANPFRALQGYVVQHLFKMPDVAGEYTATSPETVGPDLVERSHAKPIEDASALTTAVKLFVLENEGDVVGIARIDPLFVYEGFEIDEPHVVMIGVRHDYDEISQAPASLENPASPREVGRQYNRGKRVARRLTNFLRQRGHAATPYAGSLPTALNLIPAAIEAGLGELGKHGSLINRTLGASFRLAAVATDAPLNLDNRDVFGADDFCMKCQICSNACPPNAIADDKQLVRGVERWYVDFDACIPYFKETFGCGICIAECPWSRPDIGENLLKKMLKKRERSNVRDPIMDTS